MDRDSSQVSRSNASIRGSDMAVAQHGSYTICTQPSGSGEHSGKGFQIVHAVIFEVHHLVEPVTNFPSALPTAAQQLFNRRVQFFSRDGIFKPSHGASIAPQFYTFTNEIPDGRITPAC